MSKYRLTSDPYLTVHFVCPSCRHAFEAEPGRTETAEGLSHPWNYFATCQFCSFEAKQAGWEKGLMQSFGKHTGPKSAEGVAASAANLEGHPTPEAQQRIRFNAMKHGMSARVAKFFPARPGKYPHCEGCAYEVTCGVSTQWCQRRVEPFMRMHMAAESGDSTFLMSMLADNQAGMQALIEDMILSIAQEGVLIKTPKMYYDKDGKCHVFEYLDEDGNKHRLHDTYANPLLSKLIEYISKDNLTLADMALTPKGQRDDETLRGHLDDEHRNKESMDGYQARQTKALEGMQELIERSQNKVKADPALIAHENNEKRN